MNFSKPNYCQEWRSHLPILPIIGPEVVHVAAHTQVHGVLRLPLLGRFNIDQVSRILHHKFTL